MATAKAPNYSPAQTAQIVAQYQSGIPVEQIAEMMGKTVRSIVAKLSREKVYVAKEYKTKNGEAPVKKDVTADFIGATLNLSENDIESLTKANKTALRAIEMFIRNSAN
jgi:predicted transcriptional regulator